MKYKTSITIMIMVICMSMTAFAQETQGNPDFVEGLGTKGQLDMKYNVPVNEAKFGLENAMLRVQNESQVQHLERVLEKVQERERERLNRLENLTIELENKTNRIIARGRGNARFLGVFNVEREIRYNLQEDGTLKHKKNFFDYFFRFEEGGTNNGI